MVTCHISNSSLDICQAKCGSSEHVRSAFLKANEQGKDKRFEKWPHFTETPSTIKRLTNRNNGNNSHNRNNDKNNRQMRRITSRQTRLSISLGPARLRTRASHRLRRLQMSLPNSHLSGSVPLFLSATHNFSIPTREMPLCEFPIELG